MRTIADSAPATRPERDAPTNLTPRDGAWEARNQRLWALTPQERVAAMRAGELSYGELTHWSSIAPHEVPLLATGQGGPGEFEWLAILEPSIAENTQHR